MEIWEEGGKEPLTMCLVPSKSRLSSHDKSVKSVVATVDIESNGAFEQSNESDIAEV